MWLTPIYMAFNEDFCKLKRSSNKILGGSFQVKRAAVELFSKFGFVKSDEILIFFNSFYCILNNNMLYFRA